jgi:hypothetical protein
MSEISRSAPALQAEVTLLDSSCAHEKLAFEQAFYTSFSQVKGNQLIRDLWIWDDEARRLRTRIPYSEQRILTVRDSMGAVNMAMAINFSQTQLQASWFGFSSPSSEPGESCEILAFFSTRQNKLASMREFLITCSQYGEREGRRWADATCTQRLLRIYLHMGSRLLASCSINGEARHQIRMDIASVSIQSSPLRLSL